MPWTSDIYPNKIDDFTVEITREKIDTLIGKSIPTSTIETIFDGLEMRIVSKSDSGYTLQVPAYRVDVQRDVDVVEDILRIYGYNNIDFSDSLKSNIAYSQRPNSTKMQRLISEQLTACGFNEILNNSLTKCSYYNEAGTYPAANCVRVINALSNDLGVLRQTLLFGGLESIAHNSNRQNADLRFYEFGNCYQYHTDKRTADDALAPYSESYHLGLWICGKRAQQTWLRATEKTSFYELKAYVHNIFSRMGIDIRNTRAENFGNELLSEGLYLRTVSGKLLATIGIVADSQLKAFDINTPVYYADVEWKQVLKESAKHKITYRDIAKYPEVKRDLALLIDKNVEFAEIERIAYETERKLLKNVSLFDVYEGRNLEAGKKSYAISFTLQDADKTLTDKQIDAIMQRLIKNFEEKTGAKLR